MKKFLALTLALVMLLTLISCGDSDINPAVNALKRALEADVAGDSETVYAFSLDPYALERHLSNYQTITEREYHDLTIDNLDDLHQNNVDRFGDNLHLSEFKVLDFKETSDPEKLKKVHSEVSWYPEDAIESLCVIQYKATISGDKDSDSQTMEVVMGKIDGRWYQIALFPAEARSIIGYP